MSRGIDVSEQALGQTDLPREPREVDGLSRAMEVQLTSG